MKKLLFLLSLVLITVWIAGFFLLNSSPVMHIFLFLSVLCYIRSIMIVEVQPRSPVSNIE